MFNISCHEQNKGYIRLSTQNLLKQKLFLKCIYRHTDPKSCSYVKQILKCIYKEQICTFNMQFSCYHFLHISFGINYTTEVSHEKEQQLFEETDGDFGVSPAQVLTGRWVRTRLPASADILKPQIVTSSVTQLLESCQRKQKEN